MNRMPTGMNSSPIEWVLLENLLKNKEEKCSPDGKCMYIRTVHVYGDTAYYTLHMLMWFEKSEYTPGVVYCIYGNGSDGNFCEDLQPENDAFQTASVRPERQIEVLKPLHTHLVTRDELSLDSQKN